MANMQTSLFSIRAYCCCIISFAACRYDHWNHTLFPVDDRDYDQRMKRVLEHQLQRGQAWLEQHVHARVPEPRVGSAIEVLWEDGVTWYRGLAVSYSYRQRMHLVEYIDDNTTEWLDFRDAAEKARDPAKLSAKDKKKKKLDDGGETKWRKIAARSRGATAQPSAAVIEDLAAAGAAAAAAAAKKAKAAEVATVATGKQQARSKSHVKSAQANSKVQAKTLSKPTTGQKTQAKGKGKGKAASKDSDTGRGENTKRKRPAPACVDASTGATEAPANAKRGDPEPTVGRRVRVWWADESKWYPGVIENYSRKYRKHRVSCFAYYCCTTKHQLSSVACLRTPINACTVLLIRRW